MEISDNTLQYIKEEMDKKDYVTATIEKKGPTRPIDVVIQYRKRFEDKEGPEKKEEKPRKPVFRKG